MLSLTNIHTFYGPIEALGGIDISVKQGEIVCLIGNNGAGKSTTLMTISGVLKPRTGDIFFDRERISGISPHQIVERGISQVPEGRRIFPKLSVEENLEMGAYAVVSSRFSLSGKLKTKNRQLKMQMERVYELFPILKERRRQTAGTLSGGEQQMLAMGRALMSGPQLLMLDEPSLGLAPIVLMDIMNALTRIRQSGTSILLVEQNAAESLRIADHGYVLETGNIVLAGKGCDLMADARIKKSYLGA